MKISLIYNVQFGKTVIASKQLYTFFEKTSLSFILKISQQIKT